MGGCFVSELRKEQKIPNHVAIILDGNGRWAKKRHLPRNYGHTKGSKVVEKICEEAYNIGISYLTIYAFSTENWKRPDDEVEALMKLLKSYLKSCIHTCKKNNMRVKVLGDISRLSDDIKKSIAELENVSAENTGLNFQVALNYGSRDEILRGIKNLIKDYDNKEITLDEINNELFSNYLDTKGIPDPDLLIRTSGEQRLSNYLLWQLAYSELYFTDVLWPDFTKEDLLKAIESYNNRDRRYGGV